MTCTFKSVSWASHLTYLMVQALIHIYVIPSRFLIVSSSGLLLAWLKVVARDQPDAAVAAVYFSFPPAIILVTENGEVITLGEAKFFRNRGLVYVQGAG